MTKGSEENTNTDDSPLQYRLLLQETYLQKAAQELNERPEIVSERIDQLRNLILDEKRLYCRTDTDYLLRFLRARKFDVNRGFSMIKRYYQVRKDNPQLFENIRPSAHEGFIRANIQMVLDRRDNNGARIYLFRLQNCDMNVVTVDDVFKVNLMVMELISMEPETQISGVNIIVDLKNFAMQHHYRLLSPYYVKYSVDAVQESFPLRFCGFHVMNEPFYFQKLYAAIKPFMKTKMSKRIHFHGSKLSSLHKFFDRSVLPQEYGGLVPDNSKSWSQKLLSNEHILEDIRSYGYDKRPEQENTEKS